MSNEQAIKSNCKVSKVLANQQTFNSQIKLRKIPLDSETFSSNFNKIFQLSNPRLQLVVSIIIYITIEILLIYLYIIYNKYFVIARMTSFCVQMIYVDEYYINYTFMYGIQNLCVLGCNSTDCLVLCIWHGSS